MGRRACAGLGVPRSSRIEQLESHAPLHTYIDIRNTRTREVHAEFQISEDTRDTRHVATVSGGAGRGGERRTAAGPGRRPRVILYILGKKK